MRTECASGIKAYIYTALVHMRCGLESHLLRQFSVDAVTKQNSRMDFRKSRNEAPQALML